MCAKRIRANANIALRPTKAISVTRREREISHHFIPDNGVTTDFSNAATKENLFVKYFAME